MIAHADQVKAAAVLQADVCIVGAGAAGVTLALALGGSGLNVLVLEGGTDSFDKAAQDLYEGDVADPAMHSPPVFYRQRRLGGATTIWGGRCVPLDPQDFDARDGVPGSGWPVRHADIAAYYPAATRLCEAGNGGYDAAADLPAGQPSLFSREIGHGVTVDGLERFSCPTDFGSRYRGRLARSASVRVLLGANCTAIAASPGGARVDHLDVATLAGRRFSVQARVVVLAVGGLETPRLLLASNDVLPAGIGNEHDVVGRYYMCHLAGSVGQLVVHGPHDGVRHSYERTPEGIYCRRRLSLTPERQRALGVGNLVARLHFPAVGDPAHGSSVLSGIFVTRRLLSHEYSRRVANVGESGAALYLRHLRNILRYPHDAVGFLWHWTFHHTLAPRRFPSVILKNRSNRFSLELNAEQSPIPQSRVTLTDRRDALGTRRLKVDWRYARADIDSVDRTLAEFAAVFEQSGVGTYAYDPATLEHDLTCFGAYGGHHIGTARMGTDPATSVVDGNCRVHRVDNLYVAGSAVFPTSGQANPTLTLVALSLRLADHLGAQLCGRPMGAAAAVA